MHLNTPAEALDRTCPPMHLTRPEDRERFHVEAVAAELRIAAEKERLARLADLHAFFEATAQ
jgi:hypothetical protein